MKTIKRYWLAITASIVALFMLTTKLFSKFRKNKVAKIDKQIDDNNKKIDQLQGKTEVIEDQRSQVKAELDDLIEQVKETQTAKENITTETPTSAADAKDNILNKTKKTWQKKEIMKTLLIFLFPFFIYSQTVPDTCFTEQELIQISKTLDSLWEADSINNILISQQEDIIKTCRTMIALDSLQIEYQKQKIELLNDNVDLYIKRQRQLQIKWWDSKGVWFGSGIITTILTAFSISQLIN